MYLAGGGRSLPPLTLGWISSLVVDMIHEYIAVSSLMDPSVPIMVRLSHIAWAMIGHGVLVCMPWCISCISLICDGGWGEGRVIVA